MSMLLCYVYCILLYNVMIFIYGVCQCYYVMFCILCTLYYVYPIFNVSILYALLNIMTRSCAINFPAQNQSKRLLTSHTGPPGP